MTTSYGEWHTLTVELDSEDDDGNPAPGYALDHPDSCPPPAGPDNEFYMYQCWVDDLVGEFADQPGIVGLPTEPGVYRIRAWGTSGDWVGSHYIEPDSGVEVDEGWRPEQAS
ncbi:hypothetical protein [Nocardia wallacei]|uniref:hypothetical protein n=1 Tax=Nocardia wallacei TaxID=480035 RepID=UPI002456F3BB|nr:hypothetical protein [Nocardia wallacei]